MAFTKEQQKALDLSPRNRLVSAAAGSGKTAVLTERILQIVKNPKNGIHINDLLVLTFTNAAAAEMKQRITGKLLNELESILAGPSPDMKQAAHLQEEAGRLDTAEITTMDAFFQELLTNYGFQAGLPPKVRLAADENELYLMALHVLDEVMEKEYKDNKEDFRKLVTATQRQYRDRPLRQMILEIYNFSRSSPFPEYWIEKLPEDCTVPAGATSLDDIPWCRNLLETFKEGIEKALEKYRLTGEILDSIHGDQDVADMVAQYRDMIGRDCKSLRNLQGRSSWKAIRNELASPDIWQRAPTTTKFLKTHHDFPKDEINRSRDKVKNEFNKGKSPFFNHTDPIPDKNWIDQANEMQNMVRTVSRITLEFTHAFNDAKKEAGVMDFNDAAHYVLSLLIDREKLGNSRNPADAARCPSKLALTLRKRYKEILVDEYQDTNATQDLICALLSSGNNRFMVGDIRQSIYRFRQADPTIFLDKYKTYKTGNKDSERIDLTKNFRSDAVILSCINYIFRRLMGNDPSQCPLEFSYGDGEAMHAGRHENPKPQKYAGCYSTSDLPKSLKGNSSEAPEGAAADKKPRVTIELTTLTYTDDDDDDNDNDNHQTTGENDREEEDDTASTAVSREEQVKIAAEGHLIAAQIRDLVDGKWQVMNEDGTYRDIRYSDIAILVRSANTGKPETAPTLIEILGKHNIPAVTPLPGESFQNTMEAAPLIALLKILDNPLQDIPLTAVLRSCFVGLTEKDLAALYIHKTTRALWNTISYGHPENFLPAEKGRKLKEFLAHYGEWKRMAASGAAPLVKDILRKTGYLTYVSGLPMGAVRRQHILEIYEAARASDERPGAGLYAFLSYMSSLSEEEREILSKETLPAPEDAVTISTIHKAKGLEYPVVFLADADKKFHTIRSHDFLCHKDMGLSLPYFDEKGHAKWDSLYYLAMKRKLDMEQRSEEARVLYVALSRARDKLFIIGAIAGKDPEKDLKNKMDQWAAPNLKPAGTTAGTAPLSHVAVVKAGSFLDWVMTASLPHPSMRNAWNYGKGQKATDITDVPGDSSAFDFAVIDASPFLSKTSTAGDISRDLLCRWAEEKSSTVPKDLAHRLSWTYPYAEAVNAPAKLTATSATALMEENNTDGTPSTVLAETMEPEDKQSIFTRANRKPAFLMKSAFESGSAYGTLMHKAMEMIDFTKLPEKADPNRMKEALTDAINSLKKRGAFSQEEANFLLQGGKARNRKPLDQLLAFTHSGLFDRMKKAKHIHKEMPFTILLPVSDFRKTTGKRPSTDKLLMQGVMDCLLEGKDSLFIIDYKTDRIRDENEFRDHYTQQLCIYREAAEKLFHKPVTGLSLWSFEIEKEISLL